jgi:hypothetical protein
MDISHLFVINKGLKHTPPHQIFLQVNDNVSTLDVVEHFATLLENPIYRLRYDRFSLCLISHLLLQSEIAA